MQAPQTPLAGRYRFSRSLQTGAKSVSWLAIDEKTRRTVIVSALGAARVAGLEGIVGVRHAHLAAIVDVIHDADPDSLPAPAVKAPAVVVAEYVHGTTLHDALRAGRPELLEAVEIVEKLAEAIESLHAIGGVHGAISPRSVVATPENGPQGPVLTQLVAPPSGSYCSPERLRGHGPSTVDDMWALYATLYATLTGTTPFSGTSRERLVKSMVSAGARPLAEHGIFDAALEGLIARGLAAEPGKRSTDIVEFREALGAWKASRTSMAPPEATGQTPIQPADDNEAEWDDDNAQTIVSSAAELLAAARTMGAASKGAADQVEQLLADADAADAAARELEEDEDEDDAPTSVVDIAQLGFVRPSSPEPPKPPRPSSPGKAAPPPPPLPPPPPPASSPHSAGPMAAGGSAYADDEEEAATRILDSQSVLSPEQMEAIRRGMSKDEEEFDEDATVNSQSVLTDAQREEIRRAMMGDFDEEATLALAPDDARMAMAQPPAAGAPPPAAAPPPPPVAPAPVTPQDATIVAGDAPPGKSRKSGVIVWALLTVLVACGVTGYLMRDRLMPLLAGLGLPIPGLKKSIQPKTATPPPGGAAVPSTTPGDAGSDANVVRRCGSGWRGWRRGPGRGGLGAEGPSQVARRVRSVLLRARHVPQRTRVRLPVQGE